MRHANAVLPVLLLLAIPQSTAAEDSGTIVQQLRQAIGGDLPSTVHITAAGTGYTSDQQSKRHSYWIQSYARDTDLGALSASEQVIRADNRAASPSPPVTRTVRADGKPDEQALFWTTPYGFVAGAMQRQPTTTSETLYGQPYTVVSFTTPAGQVVKGYVNKDHKLERIRTSYRDPLRGNVDVEQILDDWTNAGGVTFPRMLIRHENGELSRVLIVKDVHREPAAAATHS
jgi:hypothetical protein